MLTEFHPLATHRRLRPFNALASLLAVALTLIALLACRVARPSAPQDHLTRTQCQPALHPSSRFNDTAATAELIHASQFAARIIVSEVNKLIFCPVPKAANSNWKYLIRKFEGLSDYADLTKAHNANLSGLRYLSDYSPAEIHTLIHDPSFFKFVFVRNPYSRLLSCYMDKFRNTNPEYTHTEYRTFLAQLFHWHYARTVDIQSTPRPSFHTFVDELLKQPVHIMNAHWMPQTLFCGIGVMPYDFVGRMESLSQDTAYVLRRIHKSAETFPTQQQIGFPPSGASAHVANDLYTVDLLLKVRAIYEADFRMLLYH